MGNQRILDTEDKTRRYELVFRQLESVLSGETDDVARMSTVAAALHAEFPFLWTGFYVVRGSELVVGPFQGPLACLRIARGRGVCGTAWSEKRTIVVPDVHAFPGHIACSNLSRSEIVVPVLHDGEVVAVLDIDSCDTGAFDDIDAQSLERIVRLLEH